MVPCDLSRASRLAFVFTFRPIDLALDNSATEPARNAHGSAQCAAERAVAPACGAHSTVRRIHSPRAQCGDLIAENATRL